jgi:hypothetical protein
LPLVEAGEEVGKATQLETGRVSTDQNLKPSRSLEQLPALGAIRGADLGNLCHVRGEVRHAAGDRAVGVDGAVDPTG